MQSTICVHTSDKHYTQKTSPEFSTSPIGKTKPNMDALGGMIWDSSETLYWSLDSDYKWLTKDEQTNIIKSAFLETSLATPLKIQQRRKETADPQIHINWLGKKDYPYFTSESILACAYGPASGIGGDVTMNADVLWLLRKTPLTAKEAKEKGYIGEYSQANNEIRYYDPVHTMKHEAGGHACGLKHLESPALMKLAIMYPYYNGLRNFGNADIEYVQQLYGKSTKIDRISKLVQNKMGKI